METVSNAATTAATTATNAATTVLSTASKMVFGETKPEDQSGTEPRSGATGAADEPYDAGNAEPGNPGKDATTKPDAATSAATPDTSAPPPSTAAHTDPAPPAASVDSPAAVTEEKKTVAESSTVGEAHQGAAKPTETPSTAQASAIADKTVTAESALAKDTPAVAVSDTKPVEPVFDASKPGAVTDSDNLPKDPTPASKDVAVSKAPEASSSSSPSTPETKKKGTLSKLKEKLHIGSKKNKE